ncbi:DUF4230 domain-containing protein [Micromonospora sp. M12]
MEKSYVFAEQRGLLNRLGDLVGNDPNRQQQVYQLAEERITAAARDSGLSARAEENTRKMLEGCSAPSASSRSRSPTRPLTCPSVRRSARTDSRRSGRSVSRQTPSSARPRRQVRPRPARSVRRARAQDLRNFRDVAASRVSEAATSLKLVPQAGRCRRRGAPAEAARDQTGGVSGRALGVGRPRQRVCRGLPARASVLGGGEVAVLVRHQHPQDQVDDHLRAGQQ